MTKEKVLLIYEKNKSIRRTAAETGLSQPTVKKILVNESLFTTKRSEEIRELYKHGLNVREIMEETGLSRSAVHSYLPYTKGLYNSDNPTQNALNVRRCRSKKKQDCH